MKKKVVSVLLCVAMTARNGRKRCTETVSGNS